VSAAAPATNTPFFMVMGGENQIAIFQVKIYSFFEGAVIG
jgi:hypothetical protein